MVQLLVAASSGRSSVIDHCYSILALSRPDTFCYQKSTDPFLFAADPFLFAEEEGFGGGDGDAPADAEAGFGDP